MPICRCGDCRHWGTPEEVGPFRTCRAVEHDERNLVGDALVEDDLSGPYADAWFDEDDIAERRAYRASHRAVVEDGSGFRAALRCREDFGCVLWEAEEASDG